MIKAYSFNIKKYSKNKGFTLIELLVVISIIGLLSSIVLTSLNSARIKGYDAARLGDLHSLENAFNLALDDNGGNFPTIIGHRAVCIGTTSSCWGGNIQGSSSVINFLKPYISSIPKDPKRTTGKGDRFLYVDKYGSVAQHCSGLFYPHGPLIAWVPENNNPRSDADCKNASFVACCGSISCSPNGYYCVYKLK